MASAADELRALLVENPEVARTLTDEDDAPLNGPVRSLPALVGTFVPSSSRPPKGFKRIKMKHRRIVALHISGEDHATIAKTVGVSVGTVSTVLNNPSIKPILERIYEDFDNRIRGLKPAVYEALRDSLVNGSRREKMNAIDRWGKITGEFEQQTDEGITAEDVVRRVLEVRHESPDGSVTEIRMGEEKK